MRIASDFRAALLSQNLIEQAFFQNHLHGDAAAAMIDIPNSCIFHIRILRQCFRKSGRFTYSERSGNGLFQAVHQALNQPVFFIQRAEPFRRLE